MSIDFLKRVAQNLDLHSYQCVYGSGSYIGGYAHATSDIDIFVVTDTSDERPAAGINRDVTVKPFPPIRIGYAEGRRVDIEFWSPEQIQQLLEGSSTAEGRRTLSHGDMDFLWRLNTASSIFGADQLSSYQHRINDEALIRQFIQRSVYSAEARLDDVAGLAASGQALMAALSARDAFTRIVDAELNLNGSPGPPSKWRTKRLSECPDLTDLYTEFIRVETMAGYGPDTEQTWVEDVVLASRTRLAEIGNIVD